MTTAWAHLPNAKHIDWVLDSVHTSPSTWYAAARNTARGAAWDAAWDATWDAARDAARGAAWDATRDATRDAARAAILALIAWDDSSDVLIMPVDAVRTLAYCGDHRAILLMPACLAREGLLSLKENTP